MLTFPDLKRRLVGWLALLAPLPLPFNDIVHPLVLLVYSALILVFLRRARRVEAGSEPGWLPNWAVNVLALVYLPIFIFDAFALSGGQFVRPVVHLLLFAVIVKLFSFVREKDKWQSLLAVMFLFLASMATSVHISVMLYLAAFLALAIALLTRFACLNVLAGFGRHDALWAEIPLRPFLMPATIAILVLAVPFFIVLPRIQAPFLVGRGSASGVSLQAGIGGEVNLDTIGLARGNSEVVLRVRYASEPIAPEELRFRVRAHDVFTGSAWEANDSIVENLHREPGSSGMRIGPGRAVSSAEVLQLPVLDFAIALPVEAVDINLNDLPLGRTALGVLPIRTGGRSIPLFRVSLAAQPIPVAGEPPLPGSPSLDTAEISPEIRALAAERAVGSTPRQKAQVIERFLQRDYEYTEALIGSGVSIDDFLFRYKSGHCEYFATAMVLLLRSAGVPARLVTGYLGAEANPFQSYHVVRQSNAHAWVEVYLEDEGGWVIFDPTPALGRPMVRGGLAGVAGQLYDLLVMQWDRYVLTYGLNDQFRIFLWARDTWNGLWDLFSPRAKSKPSRGRSLPDATSPTEPELSPEPSLSRWWLAIALVPGAALLWWWRRHRHSGPLATRLYEGLRQRLARAGDPLDGTLAPLAVRERARRRFPAAAATIDRVIAAYLAESFGGEMLGRIPAAELEAELKRVGREAKTRRGR